MKLKPPASSFLISNPANSTLRLFIDRMAAPDKPPGEMFLFAQIYLYRVDHCYSLVDHVSVFQYFFRNIIQWVVLAMLCYAFHGTRNNSCIRSSLINSVPVAKIYNHARCYKLSHEIETRD